MSIARPLVRHDHPHGRSQVGLGGRAFDGLAGRGLGALRGPAAARARARGCVRRERCLCLSRSCVSSSSLDLPHSPMCVGVLLVVGAALNVLNRDATGSANDGGGFGHPGPQGCVGVVGDWIDDGDERMEGSQSPTASRRQAHPLNAASEDPQYAASGPPPQAGAARTARPPPGHGQPPEWQRRAADRGCGGGCLPAPGHEGRGRPGRGRRRE